MTETTTIAAESFLTEQTEVEAILSAAGVLGVELKLVNGTVTATGKVSKLDPYLKRRIAKAKVNGRSSLDSRCRPQGVGRYTCFFEFLGNGLSNHTHDKL